MKRFLLVLVFFVSAVVFNEAYSQLPQCSRCKKAKEKHRKQSKRTHGILVGVKGKQSKDTLKQIIKAKKKSVKAEQKLKKQEEKEQRLTEKYESKEGQKEENKDSDILKLEY